ncbi:hypothetical protein ACFX16_042531 [Malus domestica]
MYGSVYWKYTFCRVLVMFVTVNGGQISLDLDAVAPNPVTNQKIKVAATVMFPVLTASGTRDLTLPSPLGVEELQQPMRMIVNLFAVSEIACGVAVKYSVSEVVLWVAGPKRNINSAAPVLVVLQLLVETSLFTHTSSSFFPTENRLGYGRIKEHDPWELADQYSTTEHDTFPFWKLGLASASDNAANKNNEGKAKVNQQSLRIPSILIIFPSSTYSQQQRGCNL